MRIRIQVLRDDGKVLVEEILDPRYGSSSWFTPPGQEIVSEDGTYLLTGFQFSVRTQPPPDFLTDMRQEIAALPSCSTEARADVVEAMEEMRAEAKLDEVTGQLDHATALHGWDTVTWKRARKAE